MLHILNICPIFDPLCSYWAHFNILEMEITIKVIDRDRLSQQIGDEITKIKATANFQIKRDPDYGDKLIGKIEVWGYSDWSFAVYVPVKAFK